MGGRQAVKPPSWFWDFWDAHVTGVSVYPAASIAEVPFFIRLRARAFHEALRGAKAAANKRGTPVMMVEI